MKKLSTADVERYKSKLLILRSQLRGDITTIMKHTAKSETDSVGAAAGTQLHMAELGTDSFEQEFNFSIMEAGAGRLSEIEEALWRIKCGTYGVCENCQARIPKTRLDAIPYASLCIKCATERCKLR